MEPGLRPVVQSDSGETSSNHSLPWLRFWPAFIAGHSDEAVAIAPPRLSGNNSTCGIQRRPAASPGKSSFSGDSVSAALTPLEQPPGADSHWSQRQGRAWKVATSGAVSAVQPGSSLVSGRCRSTPTGLRCAARADDIFLPEAAGRTFYAGVSGLV